jgi:hypothetical protein
MPITTNLPHSAGVDPPTPSPQPVGSIETTTTWADLMRESKMPVERDDVGMAVNRQPAVPSHRGSLY